MRATISRMISQSGSPSARRRHQHLHRALDAGERIAHFVRDDRGHLAEARERRLLGEALLGGLARGDVGADGDVLVRLPAFVQERDDRRVHPVERAVLGAVADLAVPHAPAGDGAPQVPHELLRVVPGIDDPMVLADQFLA